MQIQNCKFRITHPLGTKSFEFSWHNIFVYGGTVYAHVPGLTDVELSNFSSGYYADWNIEIIPK